MRDLNTLDPRTVIFGNIFRLANQLQTVMDQCAKELTAKQWFLLAVLWLFEEPPTLRRLAEASGSSHQNTKQLVLKLEAKGFVRTEPDPADRRALRVVATRECLRWAAENESFEQRFLAQMFEGLSPEEITGMNAAQQKLLGTLETMRGKGGTE